MARLSEHYQLQGYRPLHPTTAYHPKKALNTKVFSVQVAAIKDEQS